MAGAGRKIDRSEPVSQPAQRLSREGPARVQNTRLHRLTARSALPINSDASPANRMGP